MAKTTIEHLRFQELLETLIKLKTKQNDMGIRLGIAFAIEKVEEAIASIKTNNLS